MLEYTKGKERCVWRLQNGEIAEFFLSRGVSNQFGPVTIELGTYLVSRNAPAALGNKLGGLLVDGRLSSSNLVLYAS
jgi:hypothetical protein